MGAGSHQNITVMKSKKLLHKRSGVCTSLLLPLHKRSGVLDLEL